MLKQRRRMGTYTPKVSYGLPDTRDPLHPRTLSMAPMTYIDLLGPTITSMVPKI
jgi:hypothetical protein